MIIDSLSEVKIYFWMTTLQENEVNGIPGIKESSSKNKSLVAEYLFWTSTT